MTNTLDQCVRFAFFESYMARPGHDNRQLALNVALWLSDLLDEPR